MPPLVPSGNAPSMVKSYVAGVIERAGSSLLDEMPVLNEFIAFNSAGTGRVPMMDAATVDFDVIQHRKTQAELKSRPNGLPSVADDVQVGQQRLKALYTHEFASFSPDLQARVRRAGENNGASLPPGSQVAMQDMGIRLRSIRAAAMRTLELWCCKLLQGGSFTQTVDGNPQTVNTGLTPTNIGGNFATSSTDIPGLLGEAAYRHRRQCGFAPDLMIASDVQRSNFAKNDKLRAFSVNQQTILGFPQGAKVDALLGTRELYHLSTYRDANDTFQNYWSDTVITFVSLRPEARTLICGTHPIIRPDQTLNDQEPWTQHAWVKNSTGDLNVREVGAWLFGLGDLDMISVWNTNA